MRRLPAKVRWTFAYVLSVCCTLLFAEAVLEDLQVLRSYGPRDIVRHVAAKLTHPHLMFAVHSIYSKVRHNELKAMTREAALTHLAEQDYFVASCIDHLPVRNPDNTVRSKADLMSHLNDVSAPSFGFFCKKECLEDLYKASLLQAPAWDQASHVRLERFHAGGPGGPTVSEPALRPAQKTLGQQLVSRRLCLLLQSAAVSMAGVSLGAW